MFQMVYQYYSYFYDSPAYDVAIVYSNTLDAIRMRFHAQAIGMYNALSRLGLRTTFVTMSQVRAKTIGSVKVLALPRNERLSSGDVNFIMTQITSMGVHIYAECDLPGYTDKYVSKLSDFTTQMTSMGITVNQVSAFESPSYDYSTRIDRVAIQVTPST
ncbi:hypothetical protein AKO1_002282, partial [Acrasis kona]